MGRLGSHPHVVTVFDLGEADGQPYMVTELMGGGDVEGLIEKADGPLPTAQAIEIAKAVCRGLQFAHAKGIVHRDRSRPRAARVREPRLRRPQADGGHSPQTRSVRPGSTRKASRTHPLRAASSGGVGVSAPLNEPWPDLLRRSVHGDRPRGLEGDVLQQVSPDSVLLTSPGVAPQLRTRLRPNLRYARKAAEAKAAKAAARWQFTWTSPSLACLR